MSPYLEWLSAHLPREVAEELCRAYDAAAEALSAESPGYALHVAVTPEGLLHELLVDEMQRVQGAMSAAEHRIRTVHRDSASPLAVLLHREEGARVYYHQALQEARDRLCAAARAACDAFPWAVREVLTGK